MIKVVFDTVVFVRSLINPYSWWGKIIFEYSNNYRLFVSKPVLKEIFEVLQRPELTSLFSSLKDFDKDRVIQIISQAEAVRIPNVARVSRDINDDFFIATAKAANAQYLVSADRDLLDIKEYEGIEIIDAQTFIKIIEENNS